MTRLTRLSVVSEVHYVVLRSVKEISLIPYEQDLAEIFRLFSALSQNYCIDISGYAVFTDQIHLLITPRRRSEDLSLFVQQTTRLYGRYFNDEYSRTGKIWQTRYESCLVQDPALRFKALLYIEWLPFLLSYGEPQYYHWSSYFHHSGRRSDFFMTPLKEYWDLGNTPFERQKRYKALFEGGPDSGVGELLSKSVKRGWPLAAPGFLDSIGVERARQAPLRRRGRPKKDKEESVV